MYTEQISQTIQFTAKFQKTMPRNLRIRKDRSPNGYRIRCLNKLSRSFAAAVTQSAGQAARAWNGTASSLFSSQIAFSSRFESIKNLLAQLGY
jgi:hypothetical protein